MNKKILLHALLWSSVLGLLFLWWLFNRHTYVEIDKSDEALGITPPVVEEVEEDKPVFSVTPEPYTPPVIQVAVFGLDRRDDEPARSDAMMIVQFDPEQDDIQVVSLMRDTLVDIEGVGKDKLNHAYNYGGPELAIKTINQNFGTEIRNYVAVDFQQMAKAVDVLGGVTVDVDERERVELNKNLAESKGDQEPLQTTGKVMLSGEQAVAYARIRATDDDFVRTERQREVMQSLLGTLRGASAGDLIRYWLAVSPHVETSLRQEEAISYGEEYVKGDYGFVQLRLPEDGTWSSTTTSLGGWAMTTDMDALKKRLDLYLQGDELSSPNSHTYEPLM